ncbi:MAG: tetratricopeptide repeat protein [Planctomycetota bacterium]
MRCGRFTLRQSCIKPFTLLSALIVALSASSAFAADNPPAVIEPSEPAAEATAFDSANRLYHNAKTESDYLAAADAYRRILRSDGVSASVLNNLGNAWIRAERIGPAIAAYSRALRYAPRDGRVRANLDRAVNLSSADRPASPASIWDSVFFWQDHLSPDGIGRLAAIAAACAFIAALPLAFNKKFPYAKSIIIVALLASSALFASALRRYSQYREPRGVVAVMNAKAYSNDSFDSHPAFQKPLPEGTMFDVVARRNGWTRATFRSTAGTASAWLRDEDVILYDETQPDFIDSLPPSGSR